MTVARRLKDEIRAATGLTASAGVAPNKFLAKIASGWQKPDGLTVIAPERVEHFLQGLPVDALWGVGPVTARKLRARGIEKLVDVRTADPQRAARRRRLAGRLAAAARARHRRPAGRRRARAEVVRQREHVRARPDRPRRDPRRRSTSMARDAAAWLGATRALRAHGHDQGALQRLHDHHAQPHATPPTRDERAHRRAARSRCSTRPRPAASRCACSASACTTCATSLDGREPSEPRLPFESTRRRGTTARGPTGSAMHDARHAIRRRRDDAGHDADQEVERDACRRPAGPARAPRGPTRATRTWPSGSSANV